MDHLFIGSIIHCKSFNELETIENGFIAVKNGKIVAIGNRSNIPAKFLGSLPLIELSQHQFLLPGFIDCHIHAPQYPNLGLGLDLPLLEWLETYTFPLEYNYKDKAFAQKVYKSIIRRTIHCGTTTATYFATNHKESSLILAEEATKQGQRAFIGKVCSDSICPDYYIETTSNSLRDTEEFIGNVLNLENPLVQPIVTPRFALSCSADLLNGLGKLASKYNLNIQSHISENLNEIEAVKEMCNVEAYADAYENANLLTNKCVLAHGVHLDDGELQTLKKCGTSIAHCPTSNTKLRSGFCDIRRILEAGIKVGLGTDVSGGNSASMLTAIQDALNVSHCLNFAKKQHIMGTGRVAEYDETQNKNYKPLEYNNALYLATLGGAEALALQGKCGNFEVGKDFDGLLVDISVDPLEVFDISLNLNGSNEQKSRLKKMIQKFLYAGDDRNILKVFVAGKEVKKLTNKNCF